MKNPIKYVIFDIVLLCAVVGTNAQTQLRPNQPEKFKVTPKKAVEFRIDLTEGELCDIVLKAAGDPAVYFNLIDPANKAIVKDGSLDDGHLFIAEKTGRYRLIFKWFRRYDTYSEEEDRGKEISVQYSNKLGLPKSTSSKNIRSVNEYQVKIINEPGDNGKSFLVVEKSGKIRAILRKERELDRGLYFTDDASQAYGALEKRSATLFRTTPDKTGDGTPDIAVEYYTGGAHCCFEITFIELGSHVRVLPTIETGNDRLAPIAKLPRGGLRYSAAEQAFCYWTINYAQSPQPSMIWEFNKNVELVPRFDLMRKHAPTLARITSDAAAAKKKINLNPYTSPEDNFNDFEEPFWEEMLDLIYTGHENLAWQYFDLVWPEKKPGKDKFLADFKEQLALSAYGEYKKMPKPPE